MSLAKMTLVVENDVVVGGFVEDGAGGHYDEIYAGDNDQDDVHGDDDVGRG